PSTKIKFALPKSGNTSLIVYNIFGEKIRTLIQLYLEAGIHEIDFSADELSSGVYLYALQFDGKQEMKKMILQK
ncbi:MAG: T9SS type A sorting domain-containing protein, partial [Ignavibacterium sp.]|nr:T9SS type A sorting domain-containing protein [Ignavibacterium sp.]